MPSKDGRKASRIYPVELKQEAVQMLDDGHSAMTERAPTTLAVTKKTEFIYDAFDQRVGKRLDNDGNGT